VADPKEPQVPESLLPQTPHVDSPVAPAELSTTVQESLAEVGTTPVTAGQLIDIILGRHESDYLPGRRDLVPPWPADSVRWTADRWEAGIRRILATQHKIFGRSAIVALCLLDPGVAAIAQSSGFLPAVASETRPGIATYLSSHGMGMLRRRTPLVALSTQDLPPVVERRLGGGRIGLVAVARQSGVASGAIGRWAATLGREVWEGQGAQVRSRGILEPVALGWQGEVLVAYRNVDGQGVVWEGSTPPREYVTDLPGHAAAAAVIGDGADTMIDREGHLYAGAGLVQVVGDYSGVTRFRIVAAVGDGPFPRIVAVTDGSELQVFTGTQVSVPSYRARVPIDSIVAANADFFYVHMPLGETVAYAWADLGGTGPPPSHDLPRQVTDAVFDHLAAGGRYLVASFEDTLYLYEGTGLAATRVFNSPVTAVGLSPDGRALAVATADQTVRLWRLDTPSELLLTSYTNDVAEGEDLLGIGSSVDALATLMCAKVVEPPLSVGLFGAWGSGKSFFMEKLHDRVDAITQDARESEEPQHVLWAWRNVRQVRFNAWHYASADVWSGLLDQILRDLARTGAGAMTLPKELDALQAERIRLLDLSEAELAGADEKLKEAEQNLATATGDAKQARDTLIDAESQLSSAKVDAMQKEVAQDVIAAGTSALEGLGLRTTAETVTETLVQLREARNRINPLREVVEGTGRGRLWLVLLAGPAVALVLATLAWAFRPQLSGVAAAVGGVTAALVALNALLKGAISRIDAKLRPIIAAEEKAQAAVASARAEVLKHEEAREMAESAARNAALKVEQAEVDRVEAEKKALAASPGSLLEEYLTLRSESADYRSLLGIVGTVRADLAVISHAVETHNDEMKDPQQVKRNDVVNRVILYVDDLDRCPPHVVVRVLEAVHLLLSYPLFVVVVAVDAHWVSRSLSTVYPTMLTGGEVTPDDYLEKIFQLPVWLDSPDRTTAAEMLRALFEPTGGTQATQATDDTPVADQADAGVAARTAPAGDPAVAVTTRRDGLATQPPRALQSFDGEAETVAALAPLLSRTPRALKRFLNTYRLLKVVVEGAEGLARARLLLAVATGRPDLGERLLSQILAAPDATATLGALTAKWPAEDGQWLMANAPSDPDWTVYNCNEAAPAAAAVRRFVYRTSGQLATETPGKGADLSAEAREPEDRGR
jgi:hypothetical protein